MVYSSAALSGAELDAFNQDLPFLVGTHALRDAFAASSAPLNPWSTTGNPTDTDQAAAGLPAYRGWDGHGHLITKPNANAVSWYYSAKGLGGIEIDTVLVIVDTPAALRTITVETADDDAFTTAAVTLCTFDAPPEPYVIGRWDNKALGADPYARMGHAFLGHTGTDPRRYSNVDRVRIKLQYPTPGPSAPRLTEVWLGRRRVIRHVEAPVSDLAEQSELGGAYAAGSLAGSTRYRGAARRGFSFDLGDEAERDTYRNWWRETQEGTQSFLWVESPATGPVVRMMTLDPASQVFDPVLVRGTTHRRLAFSAREYAPHASGF